MSSKDQHSYKFKEFRLDLGERRLLRDENAVALTPKVFDVLAVLVERGGHLVEKDEILRLVWEDAFVEEANVARVVHSLRKILRENKHNKFIETVPKKGYRFVAEVEKVNGNGANGIDHSYEPTRDDCINYILETGDDLVRAEDATERPGPEFFRRGGFEEAEKNEPPDDWPKANRNKKYFLAAALICAAALIGAIWLAERLRPVEIPTGNGSIAVLPLKPIDGEVRDPIYELGIAESLILKLNSNRDLTVRPLSATRKYREIDQNPTDAGREQQVDFVLSSNYQIAGGKIRVTSQLINVRTGAVEGVFKSEEDPSDIFSMQDAIANDIGNTLLARFGKRESHLTARRGTSNEEAYRLYLQAAFIFDQWDKAEIGRAIEYLEKAVEIDPDYAEAYVMLAYAYRFFAHKEVGAREQYIRSKRAVEKALELNEHLADARAVAGLLKANYENDSAGAEREFRRAIELDPDAAMPRALYAYYLMSAGRFDEAVAQNKKAMATDPGALSHQITYGMILYYSNRYDEAVAHYEKLLQKNRDFAYAYFWLWLLHDLKGDEAKAFEWFTKHRTQMKAPPESFVIYRNAYRQAGWKGILREIIAQDEKMLSGGDNIGLLYEIACFSARIGDREKAFEYLEKSRRAGASSLIFIRVDPYLTTLHGDPRFEELLERIKL
jgi:DNA-binding winged helix-turn-helix (wHTH) protein/TolB-like protein/Tfp pilus assembly protein PilF